MNFSAIEESISEEKKQFKNLLSYFFKNSRILIILLVLSAIIAVVISIWRKSPDYQVLYNNLSNEDGGFIINELNEMKIPYQISEDSKKISVPKDKVYNIRLYLAENNLPHNTVGFELLDKEKFGLSQFSEQINYQRALEGELARTIQRVNAIKNARIHIAFPKDSLFLQDKKKPSASVVLTLKYGRQLDVKQTNAILHLISSSVSGLSIKNITIIDQFGNLLNNASLISNQINNLQLKYSEEIELHYKNKIQSILEPLFGIGNVYAQISAQIDFNSREKTQESYAPNSKYENQSIRSHQKVVHDKIVNNDKYYPNSSSFLRKGDQQTKNNISVNKNMSEQKNHIFSNSNTNHDDIINYELNHTVSHIKSNIGEIKRLSAAVVINYLKDKNGKLIALNADQIKNIKKLVCESIGYSKTRGDTVHIFNENFSQNNHNVFVKTNHTNQLTVFNNNWINLIPWFISIVFFVIFLKKYICSFSKNHVLKKDVLKNKLFETKKNKDLEKCKIDSINTESNINKDSNTDQLIHQICNISNQNPRIIASIIRQWMSDKK